MVVGTAQGERFIGGSSRGNIGTNRSTDGIETNLDSSLYSAGRAEFEGGNRYTGTVTGEYHEYGQSRNPICRWNQ